MLPLKTEWQQRRLAMDRASDGVQAMADAVQEWCYNVARRGQEGRLIAIAGSFGCGKTRCLRAAATYVRDISLNVWPAVWPHPICHTVFNWPDFIRGQIDDKNDEQMDDLLRSDVTFLDDVGAEEDTYKSGAPARILGDVLGAMEKRYVFITTNIAPDNKGWSNRWDRRVTDRLLRSQARVVNLYQPGLKVESYAVYQLRQKQGKQ